ncbi:MAG: SH3 domain-containing protein [Clostridia bacterium]|nr:SH3 domain-containing protein [Clostridia bacterium]
MRTSRILKTAAVILLSAVICSSLSLGAFAEYINTFRNTGNARTNIVGVAKTQIGYAEESDSSTKYGKLLANPNAPWCTAFVVWCAEQAEVSSQVVPNTGSTNEFREFYEAISCYYRSGAYGGGYSPVPGDIAFFSTAGSLVDISSIGIVTENNGKTVKVISGNVNKKVAQQSFSLTDKTIVGYASPQYYLCEPKGIVSNKSTGYYTVNASPSLRLREKPDIESEILAAIPNGTKVYVSKSDGNWGYASYDGKSGWIFLEYCDYTPVGNGKSIYLIADISQWNEPRLLKWDKFKACGIEGVILRIGGRYYGPSKALYSDNDYIAHYKSAKAAGLHVGVYFFSYALNKAQAQEEADYTLALLKKGDMELDLPVFIDIEDYTESNGSDLQHYKAGKTACTTVVNTFCDAIKNAGYYPGIYCTKSFAETLIDASAFTGRAVWIAQYGVSKCTYSRNYDMWQYTKSGRVEAFSGKLDLSYCYTDLPALINNTPPVESYGEHIAGEWKTTKAPTCVSEGLRQKTCVDCGKVLVTEAIPKDAHKYSKIQVEKKVSLTSDGSIKYTCANCSASFTETISAPVYCDADLDGMVTASDARLALRYAVGLEKLPDASLTAADADNSKSVTSADARQILRIAVDLDDAKKTMELYY